MRIWKPVLLTLALAATAAGAQAEPAEILVTPAWLAERLGDPRLVVLHVAGVRDDYDRGHIPGARYLWLNWLAESTPERSTQVPPLREVERRLENLGVSSDSRIVLCHVLGDPTAAARAFVALDRAGLGDRTHILDGGLEAWKAEGRPVATEPARFRRGRLTLRPRPEVIADLEYVAAARGREGVRVVDARSPQAYRAAPSAMQVRGGHIPGAVNLPYTTVTDSTGRYLPADSLRARFEAAGVKAGDEVVAYCFVGRTASPVYVAARALGYRVRLYDGSFEEWSRRTDLPVEGEGSR